MLTPPFAQKEAFVERFSTPLFTHELISGLGDQNMDALLAKGIIKKVTADGSFLAVGQKVASLSPHTHHIHFTIADRCGN